MAAHGVKPRSVEGSAPAPRMRIAAWLAQELGDVELGAKLDVSVTGIVVVGVNVDLDGDGDLDRGRHALTLTPSWSTIPLD